MSRRISTQYGDVFIATGTVLEHGKTVHEQTMERTEVVGYAHRTTRTTTSTSTQEIALREDDGTEHIGSLPEHLMLGLRNGSRATLAWFVPTGSQYRIYAAAANLDTGEIRRVGLHNSNKTVGCMIAGIGILLLAVGGLGIIILGGLGWWWHKMKKRTEAVMAIVDVEISKENARK